MAGNVFNQSKEVRSVEVDSDEGAREVDLDPSIQ